MRTTSPADSRVTAQKSGVYDAVLTWTNYDGCNDPGAAVYILNGRVTGTGDDGLHAALASLHRLPAGARLLIYPVGYFGFTKSPGFYEYLPPFWQHYDKLGDSIKHLDLTYGDEDELGRNVGRVLPATRHSPTTLPQEGLPGGATTQALPSPP